MKRVAVLQSSYVPWKGYFDIINSVDEFILYDEVQFTKNDWRNRNLVKTREGTAWLTIPVRGTGRFGQSIREVEIGDPRWPEKHRKTLQGCYARAACFAEVAPPLFSLYDRAAEETSLSRVNEVFLRGLCGLLEIRTAITRSSDYELRGDRNERLAGLCKQAGADEYLSGPSARTYLDEGLFRTRGIAVRWMSYDGYPEYRQLFPPFVHQVSILDLLFNEGVEGARRHLLSTRTAMASDVPAAALVPPAPSPEPLACSSP